MKGEEVPLHAPPSQGACKSTMCRSECLNTVMSCSIHVRVYGSSSSHTSLVSYAATGDGMSLKAVAKRVSSCTDVAH
eukprot:4530588-Amphidinium_carterae.2